MLIISDTGLRIPHEEKWRVEIMRVQSGNYFGVIIGIYLYARLLFVLILAYSLLGNNL